jgi:hypothetical protein
MLSACDILQDAEHTPSIMLFCKLNPLYAAYICRKPCNAANTVKLATPCGLKFRKFFTHLVKLIIETTPLFKNTYPFFLISNAVNRFIFLIHLFMSGKKCFTVLSMTPTRTSPDFFFFLRLPEVPEYGCGLLPCSFLIFLLSAFVLLCSSLPIVQPHQSFQVEYILYVFYC